MAVYEYLCPKCHKEFELMRPMIESDKPAKCPKCGSKAEKLMSGFGSTTGGSMQPAGRPFRKRTLVRAASSEAKTAKTKTTKPKTARPKKRQTKR